MKDLSIIIINFNQLELLEKCVQSLFERIHELDFEVIVVNNSKEDNLSEIKASFPAITVIENNNSGFPHANNIGAANANGEFLFFLNADAELASDLNAQIFNELKKLNFGALGPLLTYPDGRFQNSVGLFPSIINEYKNRKTEKAFRNNDVKVIEERKKYFSQIREIDWVTGAAMLVRKDNFNKIGKFNEEFFLYYEDIELCRRMNAAGLRNFYFPNFTVIHHKGEVQRIDNRKYLKSIQNNSQKIYYRLHNGFIQQFFLRLYKLFN